MLMPPIGVLKYMMEPRPLHFNLNTLGNSIEMKEYDALVLKIKHMPKDVR